MNFVIEKEKKLNLALTRLKNLNLKNPGLENSVKILSSKKNQLEIEKQDLEDKYKLLKVDYEGLSKRLEEMQNKEKIEQKNKLNFLKKLMN